MKQIISNDALKNLKVTLNKIEFFNENKDISIFELNNFKINNKGNIKHFKGEYFPIRYAINYSILLYDYIGVYLYLKKQYPNLEFKIIYISHKHDNKKEDNITILKMDESIVNAEESGPTFTNLFDKYNLVNYLEIGVFKGENIREIKAAHKDGVDPGAEGYTSPEVNYPMTSDDFFELINKKYDEEKVIILQKR